MRSMGFVTGMACRTIWQLFENGRNGNGSEVVTHTGRWAWSTVVPNWVGDALAFADAKRSPRARVRLGGVGDSAAHRAQLSAAFVFNDLNSDQAHRARAASAAANIKHLAGNRAQPSALIPSPPSGGYSGADGGRFRHTFRRQFGRTKKAPPSLGAGPRGNGRRLP